MISRERSSARLKLDLAAVALAELGRGSDGIGADVEQILLVFRFPHVLIRMRSYGGYEMNRLITVFLLLTSFLMSDLACATQTMGWLIESHSTVTRDGKTASAEGKSLIDANSTIWFPLLHVSEDEILLIKLGPQDHETVHAEYLLVNHRPGHESTTQLGQALNFLTPSELKSETRDIQGDKIADILIQTKISPRTYSTAN